MAEFKPKVWMKCPLCGKQSPMPDPDVREWGGLTHEEIDEIYCDTELFVGNAWEGLAEGEVGPMFPITLYERFEAKLKEKNT